MNIINGIVVVLLAGIVGLICCGLVTIAYEDWYHCPKDIGAGLLVVFNGILGGIAGCILGVFVLSLVGAEFVKALAWSMGLIAGTSSAFASVLYLSSDYYPAPRISGDKLMFEMEVQYPVGHERPDGEYTFNLTEMKDGEDYGSWKGEVHFENLRLENDRWLLPASLELLTSRPQRIAKLSLGEESLIEFSIPLSGRPGKADLQWTPWQAQDRESSGADSLEYRFRVSRIPQPRSLSDAEQLPKPRQRSKLSSKQFRSTRHWKTGSPL